MKILCLLLFACLALPAHAELWGYVDAAGVAHFAPRELDTRYKPVLGSVGMQRVPGKTDAGLALLNWLDIAPEVKAVQPWVREAAAQTGVDAELLKAVIAVESGYQKGAVSPRGAMGLMQIRPETASRYASPAEAARLIEPRINIRTGARMLADLIRRFGHIDAALAAWNADEGAVRRAGNRVPDIDETQAHVHLVLELYWALLQQSQPAHAQRLTLHP
ncbi:lytic transglycosylase domain-containing protein [Roseateles saccharophilus]|uniref:Transglycosylase-like protein with SLT domain n=1 Tax=Roseateles saccharophilus TaxID=304 RepID=A0A4V2VSV4_ROSSA|nr:lytic transglycosylase domain-containing protein [Roseateles saccharophilus]MDG0834518.1 lytic transglycosylase domain-containing protein [Roseateles saccharophilus]TCV03790.1 transglycosylase-like protein with SLT domain [Roseateles saccharophilus]